MIVVCVVGARPQFVKAAPVLAALRRRHTAVLVHTGQHYDANMSDVFFDELELPRPDVNLGVGSGSHAVQTAHMLERLERVLQGLQPDWVLVLGDTNSTLAAALAAAKLNQPVAHVEAGMRSFNQSMPEEINRVVTDHLAQLCLCPSETAVRNLSAEGVCRGVHCVGDVMIEALTSAERAAGSRPSILERLGLRAGGYFLATVHRAGNVDGDEPLTGIVTALNRLDAPVVLPLHPRTRRRLEAIETGFAAHVRTIDPIGHVDMTTLQRGARMVLTDSGGVQKEAYWLGVPCVTLREETEWVETIETGWNVLAGTDPDRIVRAVSNWTPPASRPPLYGDGRTSDRIVELLESSRVGPQ